jgi:hypothetical protein
MPRIFISYRRKDSEGYTGRLFDYLKTRYTASEIFMDVATILPGARFAQDIQRAISTCEVLLAVIGPHWLTLQDEQGARRIDNPQDYVRQEISAAIRQNIRLIPVLVGGAALPSAADLPEVLKPLRGRTAHTLSHDRFPADADLLVQAIGGSFATIAVKLGLLNTPHDHVRFTNCLIEIFLDNEVIGRFGQKPSVDPLVLPDILSNWPISRSVADGKHRIYATAEGRRSIYGSLEQTRAPLTSIHPPVRYDPEWYNLKSRMIEFNIRGGQTFNFGVAIVESHGRFELVLDPVDPLTHP